MSRWTAAQAGDIPAPTPEVLEQIFRRAQDAVPRARIPQGHVAFPRPVRAREARCVSDADAKAYFEQRKDRYGTPERRQVQQIVFPKTGGSRRRRERIAKGASFDDIAKERQLNEKDIDLGTVAKSRHHRSRRCRCSLRAQGGRDERAGERPVRHRAAASRQDRARRGKDRSSRSPAQLKRELAESRGKIGSLAICDKIEDERADGKTLAETAKKLGLKSVTIEAVDRSGRGPTASPSPDCRRPRTSSAPAFATDVGVDSDPLQLPSGGYVWL